MSVTLSVNSDFVIDRLNQIARRVDDMGPAFSEIGMELETEYGAALKPRVTPVETPGRPGSPAPF